MTTKIDSDTLPKGMRIKAFAKLHKVSPNTIRKLVRQKLIKAVLVMKKHTPVPYYLIPEGTVLPEIPIGRPKGSKTHCSGCGKVGHDVRACPGSKKA